MSTYSLASQYASGARRQCSHVRKDGTRCGSWCVDASVDICQTHGGKLPSVRNAVAARREEVRGRMLDFVPRAVAELERIIMDPLEEGAVKVKAALGYMDRAGFNATQKIEIDHDPHSEFRSMSTEAILERAEELMAKMRAALDEKNRKQLEAKETLDFIDAEILDHETTGRELPVPLEVAKEAREKLALVAGDGN